MTLKVTTLPKPIVLGLTGYAQTGKDTAAGFLVDKGWTRLSFADALRQGVYALNPIVGVASTYEDDALIDHWLRVQDIIDTLGYEKAKATYPEYRELLQRFGTDVGRDIFGESFWTDRVVTQIHNGGKYVISDVRFPNEAEVVRSFGGKVWRIRREGTGAVNSHISDTGIDSLVVDGVIPNTGSMDHFRELVLMAAGVPLD